ncbi:MAG TPA: hypothetical protein VM287_06025, partial [Egibacteraceae bacterium]|nr:hypothetical protein [Egibacteraceae bacterium]
MQDGGAVPALLGVDRAAVPQHEPLGGLRRVDFSAVRVGHPRPTVTRAHPEPATACGDGVGV